MTLKQLTDEIGSKVQKLQEAARTPLHKQFLIAAVMADHDQIQGTDRPFALICVRYAVEQTVDRFFRDLKQKELDHGARRRPSDRAGGGNERRRTAREDRAA